MTTSRGRTGPAPIDDERCPTGIAVAAGVTAVVGVAAMAAVFTRAPGPRLALLVVAVGAFAAVAGDGRAALALAGVAWPVGNGFLVNHRGDLSWHGGLDVWFLFGLLAAVAVGMTVAEIRRELRSRRRWRPFTALLREASGHTQPVSVSGSESVWPDGRVESAGAAEESGR